MAINLAAPMAQGLRHQLVVTHDGVALEEMLFGVLKRFRDFRRSRRNVPGTL